MASESESMSSSSSHSAVVYQEENGIIYIPIDTDNESSANGSSSSSSVLDADHQAQSLLVENNGNLSQLPSTRDHSYLPGTQYPLYPAEFLRHPGASAARNYNSNPTVSTDSSCSHDVMIGCGRMQLPILQLDGVVIFPNSTLPLRITNTSLCQYLRREIEHVRTRIVSGCSTDNHNSMQVRIGIVTRLQHRRRSGVHRLRRQAAIDNVLNQGRNQGGNEEEPEARVNRRMGRWNMALIRRNIIPRRQSTVEEDSSSSSDEASSVEDTLASRETSEQGRQSSQPHRENPEERSINYGRSLPKDRLQGRIGTIATILSVNEIEPRVGSDRNVNVDESQHIIVTAMATGRFKILSPVDGNESMEDFEWRVYNVEQLNDHPLYIPSSFRRPGLWKSCTDSGEGERENENDEDNGDTDSCDDNDRETDVILHKRSATFKNISTRSILPIQALQIIWPQKLVKDIVREIYRNTAYAGVRKILPDTREQYDGMFSFWLSSNIPLSNDEKLDILEASSDVERLKLLSRMIKRRNVYIRCKQCMSHIAPVSEIFSLHSSEGISGAYVNEHGVVHQTTTLNNIIDGSIVCLGSAETRDSWFPGYSWTIAYCATCFNHLGWKFLRVRRDVTPPKFWGLSGSQVI